MGDAEEMLEDLKCAYRDRAHAQERINNLKERINHVFLETEALVAAEEW